MAPRRDSAAQDQLTQPGYATDGRPSGDLQPGTQRKQAASSDSARRAAQAVALAVGVTSLPGSPDGPRVIAGTRYGATFPTAGVQRNEEPPFLAATGPFSIAAAPVSTVQDGCSDIQSPAWRRTTPPQFASACRRRAWSTSTPLCRIKPSADSAVQTVNRGRSSVSGRSSTVLEQAS